MEQPYDQTTGWVPSLFALCMFDTSEKEQRRQRSSVLTTTVKVSKNTKAGTNQSSKEFKCNPSSAQIKRQIECFCCKQSHFIYKPDTFAKMTLGERKKFVSNNNLCLSCLRIGLFSKNWGSSTSREIWNTTSRGKCFSCVKSEGAK